MLDVETNHQIILLYFREGLSLRKIANQLKISRKTVKARITEYERFKSKPVNDQLSPGSSKSRYLTSGPAYDISKRHKRRLSNEITDIIDVCLEENEVKKLEGRTKQQLKKIDIHEKILSAGYAIGYTTVCNYISARSTQVREAFIKQGYIFRAIPKSQLCVIPGSTHGALRQNATVFNDILYKFFSQPFNMPNTLDNYR